MSDAARATILGLLETRRPGATICPSEAARKLDAERWRDRMEEVWRAAALLASEGMVVATQKGETVDLALARGPVRLSLPSRNEA
ncbi:MAG: DUF3253 domain-containing protein [Pseudomonadota bacterium]